MKEKRKLKRWQGWALFVATMVVVFCLGLLASSIMQRRAEVASIFANKKVEIAPQEARNAIFQSNYPKEYVRPGYRRQTPLFLRSLMATNP